MAGDLKRISGLWLKDGKNGKFMSGEPPVNRSEFKGWLEKNGYKESRFTKDGPDKGKAMWKGVGLVR